MRPELEKQLALAIRQQANTMRKQHPDQEDPELDLVEMWAYVALVIKSRRTFTPTDVALSIFVNNLLKAAKTNPPLLSKTDHLSTYTWDQLFKSHPDSPVSEIQNRFDYIKAQGEELLANAEQEILKPRIPFPKRPPKTIIVEDPQSLYKRRKGHGPDSDKGFFGDHPADEE